MKISNVKLISDGLKGIECTYVKISVKDGREFYDEFKRKHKAPVHYELMDLFKKIPYFIADIIGVSEPLLTVKGFSYSDKGIVLQGSLEVDLPGGLKFTNINTPLVKEEDEYEGWKDLTNLLDSIYKETELFMAGERVMEDRQLVMDFYASKKMYVDYS